jgi:hypothetical protein
MLFGIAHDKIDSHGRSRPSGEATINPRCAKLPTMTSQRPGQKEIERLLWVSTAIVHICGAEASA